MAVMRLRTISLHRWILTYNLILLGTSYDYTLTLNLQQSRSMLIHNIWNADAENAMQMPIMQTTINANAMPRPKGSPTTKFFNIKLQEQSKNRQTHKTHNNTKYHSQIDVMTKTLQITDSEIARKRERRGRCVERRDTRRNGVEKATTRSIIAGSNLG